MFDYSVDWQAVSAWWNQFSTVVQLAIGGAAMLTGASTSEGIVRNIVRIVRYGCSKFAAFRAWLSKPSRIEQQIIDHRTVLNERLSANEQRLTALLVKLGETSHPHKKA